MDHLYLSALMHGEIQFKKNGKAPAKVEEQKIPILRDIDKQIDAYVDAMVFEEEDPRRIGLLSPKARKDKLKLEMKEAAKLPNLAKQIEMAIELLLSEGANNLSKEKFQQVESDFSNLSTHLSRVQLESVDEQNLQSLANISDDTMQSIAEMAIAKYAEERYTDCLALFSLLSILYPSSPEYWFRLGIAAQKCEDYTLACLAYAAATELDGNFIGARLLAVECYLRRNLLNEAKEELLAAKEIAARSEVDPMWLELLSTMETA